VVSHIKQVVLERLLNKNQRLQEIVQEIVQEPLQEPLQEEVLDK